MKIIADSGSTKTQWAIVNGDNVELIATIGLNPYHISLDEIERTIYNDVASKADSPIEGIYFYGSGVTAAMEEPMRNALAMAFSRNGQLLPSAEIIAASDMVGAARALFQDKPGIACILGTGANSCHYDGKKILANTPALGYILGDEGSGASIGKHLVNALYKDSQLAGLRQEFEQEYSTSMADIIERVYRQPMANRYLASLAPFAKRHIDNERIYALVKQDFSNFFERNLMPYPCGLPVGFIGSIAYHFEPILRAVASEKGYEIISIAQSPIEGLMRS